VTLGGMSAFHPLRTLAKWVLGGIKAGMVNTDALFRIGDAAQEAGRRARTFVSRLGWCRIAQQSAMQLARRDGRGMTGRER
jgi:hypothetical protein